LSIDKWTLDLGTSYFGIMLYLIYEKEKEHLILLNAHPKQNGFITKALTTLVCNMLDVWSLTTKYEKLWYERRIKYFTSDTTATMPVMIQLFRFHWLSCIAYILNLII
jgi:hypothetical protein